jgi:hypothetical protein
MEKVHPAAIMAPDDFGTGAQPEKWAVADYPAVTEAVQLLLLSGVLEGARS